MALCLAHATAGYLAYEAFRPAGPHRPWLLAGAVLIANAPDLDFLPGLALGAPTVFHRGLTHTLGAAVLLTASVWLVAAWRRAERPWWWAAFAAVAYGSHLLVDWMTVDAVPPFGIQLLWPLDGRWLHAPFDLFGEIIVDGTGREAFLRSLVSPVALLAWMREIGIVLAVVASVQVARAAAAVFREALDDSVEP
jgi:inner membrane protein